MSFASAFLPPPPLPPPPPCCCCCCCFCFCCFGASVATASPAPLPLLLASTSRPRRSGRRPRRTAPEIHAELLQRGQRQVVLLVVAEMVGRATRPAQGGGSGAAPCLAHCLPSIDVQPQRAHMHKLQRTHLKQEGTSARESGMPTAAQPDNAKALNKMVLIESDVIVAIAIAEAWPLLPPPPPTLRTATPPPAIRRRRLSYHSTPSQHPSQSLLFIALWSTEWQAQLGCQSRRCWGASSS